MKPLDFLPFLMKFQEATYNLISHVSEGTWQSFICRCEEANGESGMCNYRKNHLILLRTDKCIKV